MTGGHGYAIGAEVDGEDEARKAAREDMKAGARVLKVMATGGVLTPGVEPGSPQLTIEEMKAISQEAHKAGRKVAAHAHGTQGIKNAILAGVDTIEHCSYLDSEAIDLFHQNGATMVSTLLATMILIWNLDDAKLPGYVVEKIKRHVDHEVASLELAIQSGIRIAAGTDAGSGVNPHNSLSRQLELLVQHGMDEMAAIQAGTRISAETLGMEEKIGTLEPDKFADILVIKGNPLAKISAFNDLVAVMKQGNWIIA
jgi:imidazolonepropionase-like amidohydrolase